MKRFILGFAAAHIVAAHNMLITPKPRNAIDSELPEWADGKAPYVWLPGGGGRAPSNVSAPGAYYPCACRNGTDACAVAQTCLWFRSDALLAARSAMVEARVLRTQTPTIVVEVA